MNANRNSNQTINISPTTLIIDQDNIVQQQFRLVLLFFSVFLSLSRSLLLTFFLSFSLSNKLYTRKKKTTMHNCYEKEEQEEEEKE